MRATLQTRMNLEMAATDAMLAIAREVRPQDVLPGAGEARRRSRPRAASTWRARWPRLRDCCAALRERGIRVSLFIDPDPAQLDAARRDRRAGRRIAHGCLCGGDAVSSRRGN